MCFYLFSVCLNSDVMQGDCGASHLGFEGVHRNVTLVVVWLSLQKVLLVATQNTLCESAQSHCCRGCVGRCRSCKYAYCCNRFHLGVSKGRRARHEQRKKNFRVLKHETNEINMKIHLHLAPTIFNTLTFTEQGLQTLQTMDASYFVRAPRGRN